MKEVKKTINTIKQLISYSIASIRIKKLTVEESDGTKRIRPSLHLMLYAPTGSLKSTILSYIRNVCKNSMEADSITVPGMIGTVENNMITPGFAWRGRNKLLLFDEFNFQKKQENASMFLKLLEDQKYSKKFGRFIPDQKPEEDKDLYYKVENGSIELKTRFSAVIATMRKFEYMRGTNFRAFTTRLVIFPFRFTIQEQSWLLEHTKLFKPKIYSPREETKVEWKKYRRIKRIVENYVVSSKSSQQSKDENFSRLVGDAIRLHAIKNNTNKNEIKSIIDWKLSMYEKIGRYYRK